ncbi:hypothetical protein VTK26DRAFT_2513 [Humicola hyalothermophila]
MDLLRTLGLHVPDLRRLLYHGSPGWCRPEEARLVLWGQATHVCDHESPVARSISCLLITVYDHGDGLRHAWGIRR